MYKYLNYIYQQLNYKETPRFSRVPEGAKIIQCAIQPQHQVIHNCQLSGCNTVVKIQTLNSKCLIKNASKLYRPLSAFDTCPSTSKCPIFAHQLLNGGQINRTRVKRLECLYSLVLLRCRYFVNNNVYITKNSTNDTCHLAGLVCSFQQAVHHLQGKKQRHFLTEMACPLRREKQEYTCEYFKK